MIYSNDVVLVFLLFKLLAYFTPFSSFSIVDFEQINVYGVLLWAKRMKIDTIQIHTYISIYKVAASRYSVRKGALRNFARFRGKHLCWSLF